MTGKHKEKPLKECVLDSVHDAYLAINRDMVFEAKLVFDAMHKAFEKDKHTHEQFLELLTLNYMLQGIALNCSRGKCEEEIDSRDDFPF